MRCCLNFNCLWQGIENIMFKLELKPGNISYFLRRFRLKRSQRPADILMALNKAGAVVHGRAIENVTGRVLNVGKGRLLSSIRHDRARREGRSFVTAVGNKLSPVNYGAAHEYGYTVPPTLIRPKKPGGTLSWVGRDGKRRFAKYVNRPAYSVIARPWLWPAFKDSEVQIDKFLAEAGVSLLKW